MFFFICFFYFRATFETIQHVFGKCVSSPNGTYHQVLIRVHVQVLHPQFFHVDETFDMYLDYSLNPSLQIHISLSLFTKPTLKSIHFCNFFFVSENVPFRSLDVCVDIPSNDATEKMLACLD